MRDTWPRAVEPDQTDLGELRGETLRAVVIGLAVLGTIWDFALATLRTEWAITGSLRATWLAMLAVLATAALGYLAAQHSEQAAATVVIIGIAAAIALAAYVLPSVPIAVLIALDIMVATALLGWLAGLLTAVVTSLLLVGIVWQNPTFLTGEVAAVALFLTWASWLLTWMTSRPAEIAIGWAWHSYAEAVARTEELRDQQGELRRLSKSLAESCARLEQVNAELNRARQSAERARQLKEEFAAAVSHELRTPLNLILGFSEVMMVGPRPGLGEALPAGYRGDVEAIYRNACHLSNLIDDILDLSQIDAQRMGLVREWVSLPGIIKEAVATIATMFEDKGLRLTIELPDKLPLLFADPIRVRQILINLLNNAARFTETGGVRISAQVSDRELIVSVTDTGVGIPPEAIARVFDEFWQADQRSSLRRGGGLGLAICKRFVELHGGSIWATSEVGVGSTFSFSLPLCAQVVTKPLDVDWRSRVPDANGVGRRLIVLGEDEVAAKILRRYLDGFEILPMTNLDESMPVLESNLPQAIVVTSPTGHEALRQAQAWCAALNIVPAITCSLRTGRTLAEQLRLAAYLIKPVTRAQLERALHQVAPRFRRVLIVDDEPEMVHLLARMVRLIVRRCQVIEATGGVEALRLIRENTPDVVLLDLLMPDLNGYAVLEHLQADPRLAAIPVIAISAHGNEEGVVTCSELAISRPGGLSVGEMTRCLQATLGALAGSVRDYTAPTPPGGLVVSPA